MPIVTIKHIKTNSYVNSMFPIYSVKPNRGHTYPVRDPFSSTLFQATGIYTSSLNSKSVHQLKSNLYDFKN